MKTPSLEETQEMLKAATRIMETTRKQIRYLQGELEAQTEVVAFLDRKVHELMQEQGNLR